MLEIIIFAIIAFFVFKKLHSILGEEDEAHFFGADFNNSFSQKIKDAEKVDNDLNNDNEEDFAYLSAEAKEYVKELGNKIDGFSLKKFQEISTKVLELVIKANNEQNKDVIRKLLSKDLADVVCLSFDDENNKNNIILVECVDNKVEDIKKTGSIFEICVNFKMRQINYTTDKESNIIDGDKSEILDVNERWHFIHDTRSKGKTWFVDRIETY